MGVPPMKHGQDARAHTCKQEPPTIMLTLFIKMLPLVLMTLAGYMLSKHRVIDAAFNRQLSLVLVNVFYPCLIVSSIVRSFTWDSLLQNWMIPAGAAFIFVTGWLIDVSRRRCFAIIRRARDGAITICMANNYSFLPILIAASLWGEMAVALVIFSSLVPSCASGHWASKH